MSARLLPSTLALALFGVLLFAIGTGCGQTPVRLPVDAGTALADAGTGVDADGGGGDADAGSDGGTLQTGSCHALIAPPCCDPGGNRLGSAACDGTGWTCASGALCTCGGEEIGYVCVDFCGTDAARDATCGAGGWECPGGTQPSTSCPAQTCWGEPGDCCVNPMCVDGAWSCESILDPCP